MGLPYDNFVDALAVAARALREKDSIEYADTADVLQIKFCLIRKQYETARTIAQAGMKRSPQEQYWYYICSLLEQNPTAAEQKLRWAKRGLACPNKGDYLRYCLFNNATRAAIQMAINILETERKDSPRIVLAVAMLHSARDDCMEFLSEAPPDCREMEEMLVIFMCVEMVLKGSGLSPNLREFEVRVTCQTVCSFLLFTAICSPAMT
jgi:hypothetical protein